MNEFSPFLSSIRWQDVVDITLSSYILLRLYILFRGTHVLRVLIGIALLWFSQRIAVSLGLIVTSWGIQGITAVAAFIIIVVFRNEIRSVLQAKNLKSILWGFRYVSMSTPVEKITDSVFELARKQIGALLVFPGKDDLEEVVHSGISWRGLVSKEMIMSIFWHDNPVHDGAAVVQGDRITEVAAILPLSHREDLPSHYGTRHRAAAGLAEMTDALVVVVSEERGRVAVAKGTKLDIIGRKEELVRMLRQHMGLHGAEEDYPKKEKLQLGIAAFVSIVFITGVWFSFARGMVTLTTLEIPVEYMDVTQGMEILDTSVNAVRLDLSGSGALIKSLRPEQVKVRLDLSKAGEGPNTFNISPENVSLPPGVVLKRVAPPTVEVTIDVPMEKELPVQVDWAGKLPEHLILAGVEVVPHKIHIVGGARILENISTIYTKKVPLDKITETGTMMVGLALNPASLKIASGSEDSVRIKYVVKKRIE
jgi:diadenylate cyclase